MSELYDLGLSVRAVFVLEKCNVSSPGDLARLNLLELVGAGGGLVALQEARTAQLRLAELEPKALVNKEEIRDSMRSVKVGEDHLTQLEERLEGAGWQACDQAHKWKYWNREVGAVNFLTLMDGRELIDLELTQHDSRLRVWLAPQGSLEEVLRVIEAMGDELTFEKRSQFVERIQPVIGQAWVHTRGGFVPTSPLAH